MMEFTLTVRIDTQDEKLAYNELRQCLQFCGLDVTIQDTWLKNNRPFPIELADKVAGEWLVTHDALSIDRRVRYGGAWEEHFHAFMDVVDELPTVEELSNEKK